MSRSFKRERREPLTPHERDKALRAKRWKANHYTFTRVTRADLERGSHREEPK
jgi:hypothetical protein